ncbi:hypothetical protein [Pseudovibrio brasiliensis]|uniref:Uncharacterized protein n=1 Tax=Pseudovibrio brasiliensis TaxID=1898042 RepID=A0ABX8AVQ5_9HYPH|nr:hypothetical protein [Pseudovibrio brasiliensis]QUS58352.1 hypothetical protein KGB56_23795 [Pseudovibrio brasiliensis]
MPVNKLNAEQHDWAKAVYQNMHWNFPEEEGDETNLTAEASNEQANGVNGTRDQRNGTAEPDLSDYVVVDTPPPEQQNGSKASPVHSVLEEIGLPQSETLREQLGRLRDFQQKQEAFIKDPLATAYADPKASAWEHRVKDVLGMSQEKADKMVKQQFTQDLRKNMKEEGRNITKEIFDTQADDPRFTEFLKTAGNANPKQLTPAHREMLVFMSQNMVKLGNSLVKDVNELYRQHAFGKAMSDTIDNAKENAVSDSEKQKLEEIEQEVIEYRMAVARQLGMALNTTNDVQSAISFGETVNSAVDELAEQNDRALKAASGLAKMAKNMVNDHLAQTNSPRKTMKWVETQPWAKLVDIDITTKGEYFNIEAVLRDNSPQNEDTDGLDIDENTDLAQRNLSKEKLMYNPELIFNGLRSPEMMAALTSKATGEASNDDIPFVEKPSDLAMNWGETLARAQEGGRDISDQLPDYMTLKQVRYHDIKKGFFSNTDTVKTAWVVEQKPTSDTVAEVNLINNLPRAIAGDLGDLALNMSDLREDQTKKNDDIQDKRSHLDEFLSSKGDGLLQSYGNAHDAISSLQDHAMQEVMAKMSNGTSIRKILKWAKEQPWSAMFRVEITPMEGGKKDQYNVVVKEVEHGTTEANSVVLNEPTERDKENAGNIADEEDQAFGEDLHGLSGALKALLNPSVYKQLISKPTGENSDGMPVVEEPTKLARDWAELIQKSAGPGASLPDYLELRQVKYRVRSFLPWKRNKLEACWVLEFKPTAFKQAA